MGAGGEDIGKVQAAQGKVRYEDCLARVQTLTEEKLMEYMATGNKVHHVCQRPGELLFTPWHTIIVEQVHSGSVDLEGEVMRVLPVPVLCGVQVPQNHQERRQ